MSDEELPQLRERMARTSLQGPEGEALLKRLLFSMSHGAGDTHLLAARALYSASDMAEPHEKVLLFDQIFTCLARALEDLGMLLLMTWDDSRHPLDTYLNMDRPELRAFYTRCRRGTLTDEQLLRVAGVAPMEAMKRSPQFSKNELAKAEEALDWAAREARERLTRFGRLYHATLEEADSLIGPWQIAYAKAPIGLKLLVDKESGRQEMLMGVEEGPDPAQPGKTHSSAFWAEVRLDQDWAEKMMHFLEEACVEIRFRAGIKLAALENPSKVVEIFSSAYAGYIKNLGPRRGPITADTQAAQGSPDAAGEPGDEAGGGAAEHSFDAPPTAIQGEVKQIGGLKIVHSQKPK